MTKIIITNLPSFYKVNLYNQISQSTDIFVVYTGFDINRRNLDFFNAKPNFDYLNLSGKSFIHKLYIIAKLIWSNTYSELIVCGLNEYTTWLALFISPKKSNATVIESSCYESSVTGFKALIKKILISRVSKVYASGISQLKLASMLGFKGEVIITRGVGLFNYQNNPKYTPKSEIKNFIYVGRLAQEKNLFTLIHAFNNLPELNLTIVGFGPIEAELKEISKSNINFRGAVDNSKLHFVYREHDVLILPSLSEPWGLVVEEALNNGLPVIVSDRVGCVDEIVKHNFNGLVFSLNDSSGLSEALNKIQDIECYNRLRLNVSRIDFEEISKEQVKCYCR